MRHINNKLLDAARSNIADAAVRLEIAGRYYGRDVIQSCSVSAVTGDNGTFNVGATEAAELDFRILTSALPYSWTTRDIRAWLGYLVSDDSFVVGETMLLSDVTMSGDSSAVEGFMVDESIMGDTITYIGDETAELVGGYSSTSEDSTAEVQEGGWVEVETLYLQRYEYVPMGLFATSDENVTNTGLFTDVIAYDPFYWMATQCDIDFADVYPLTTRNAMSVICDAYDIDVDIDSLPDVHLPFYRPSGTVRECIGYIAAAGFANARFDGDGVLSFVTGYDTGENLDMGDYMVGALSVSSGERSTVDNVQMSYKPTSGEEVVIQYPSTSIGSGVSFGDTVFGDLDYDSPQMSLVEGTLSSIAEAAQGNGLLPVSVKGFDVTVFGGLQFDLMDRFSVMDVNGARHELMAMSVTWSYDGGITTSMSANAISSNATIGSAAMAANVAAGLGANKDAIARVEALVTDTLNGYNQEFNQAMSAIVANDENFVSTLLKSQTLLDAIAPESIEVSYINSLS